MHVVIVEPFSTRKCRFWPAPCPSGAMIRHELEAKTLESVGILTAPRGQILQLPKPAAGDTCTAGLASSLVSGTTLLTKSRNSFPMLIAQLLS